LKNPKNMNVLVLGSFYRWFIKDLVEAQSKYISEINVLIRYNRIVHLLKYLPKVGYIRHIHMHYSLEGISDNTNIPANVHVHLVPTLYFIPDGQNFKLGDKLVKIFEKYIKTYKIKFDLIHSHFTYPYGYVGAKLAEKYNAPVIITAHGHDIYDMPFRNQQWASKIKFALDRADYIITVSKKSKEILTKKLNVPSCKIYVIPNGFNPRLFTPKPRVEARLALNLPLNKKLILNVAQLLPIKGHIYLIQAMKHVVQKRSDVVCLIIGDGMLKRTLLDQVKRLGLENYIKFLGAKSHNDVPLWMNAADLFVLPSLSEGNPTVMFEALGVGLPFVGTKVGGIPEIITSEDYGLLCEPANPKDLAEKILIALEKEWDREKIRKYAEQYSWEKIAKEYFRIYQRVLLSR